MKKVFMWPVAIYNPKNHWAVIIEKDTYKYQDFSSVTIVWIEAPESLFELWHAYLLKLHVKLEIQMQAISACMPWPPASHCASILEMHNEVLNHPAWMLHFWYVPDLMRSLPFDHWNKVTGKDNKTFQKKPFKVNQFEGSLD